MRPLVLLVALLAAAAGGCSEEEPRRAQDEKVEQRDKGEERAAGRGVTVVLPSGWQRAQESLTPALGDPREVLSVATFPLRHRERPCAHMPVSALEDLGPRDALVTLQERTMGARSPQFEPRPDRFGPALGGPSEASECSETARFRDHWFAFRDRGRTFHVLVAFGPQAPAEVQDQAWRALDGLVVDPG